MNFEVQNKASNLSVRNRFQIVGYMTGGRQLGALHFAVPLRKVLFTIFALGDQKEETKSQQCSLLNYPFELD